MKTITFSNNGKRLLLKNPANTSRIPMLLELFPDANFIHIYRNPYKVYLSTIKMRNRVLDKLALQNASKKEIENQVIENYKRLMNSFFKQVKQINKKKIVEVRYEDLVANPIKQVKNIYKQLNIPGTFAEARALRYLGRVYTEKGELKHPSLDLSRFAG